MFSFFTGRKFCNKIASHLGINSALYSSALLESGVTWFHIKTLKKTGCTIPEAAETLMPNFVQGLNIVRGKFGPQQEILDAEEMVSHWVQEHES